MAFIKTAIKLIIRESVSYKFAGPLLSLGVPEVYATHPEIDSWFNSLAGQRCPLDSAEVRITDNALGKKLGWVSAGSFFKALSMSEVITVDIPGCEHTPDLIHDLNEPFPVELNDRFGLVLDPGTIEHIFDIKTCLTNVARSVKVGGVVVHHVPIYSYNGGYFSVNPNVLNDFYSANGFGEIKSYIIMWDRYRPYNGEYRVYEYSEALLGARHALADKDQCRYSPTLLFFAKKMKTLSKIEVPIQFSGHYQEAVNAHHEQKNAMAVLLRKILDFLLMILPLNKSLYLSQWLERNYSLIKTRKHSFRM